MFVSNGVEQFYMRTSYYISLLCKLVQWIFYFLESMGSHMRVDFCGFT